jgi:hypothetical protein
VRESRIAPNNMARSPPYVRVAPSNEGNAIEYRSDTTWSFKHYNHHAICARCSVNAANGDRHVEPKNRSKCDFWATGGQPVDSAAN